MVKPAAGHPPPATTPQWGVFTWLWAIIRTIIIIVINLYAVMVYLGWLVLLYPVRWVSSEVYWTLEAQMFASLQAMVAHWMWSAGYVVADIGEDVSSFAQEECLLLVNHQSTGDVPVIMTFLQDKAGVTGGVLWIIDQLFRFTHFGICSWARGDFFITTGKEGRDLELVNLRQHMQQYMWANNRKWVILFPEGGFLRKRRQVSQTYAKKNDYPMLQHCSLPRLGAMQTIMEALSSNSVGQDGCRQHHSKGYLKWVVDVTIGYPDARPLDIWCLLHGARPPCTTQVHCRLYPADTVPTQPAAMRDWLFERYVEKDALLSHFYRTGSFPAPLPAHQRYGTAFDRPALIEYTIGVCIAQHAFFLASLCLQCWLACWFFGCVTSLLCCT